MGTRSNDPETLTDKTGIGSPRCVLGLQIARWSTPWLASASLLFSGLSQAATITVDSLADATLPSDDGNCTLREAIEAANSDTGVDACPAGSGADHILFSPALSGGTINLVAGELAVTGEVTIAGPVPGDPSGLTIDAGGNSRILSLYGDYADARLSALTLTGGDSGGGAGGAVIASCGFCNVTFNDSTLSGNAASRGGAISASAATVNINNSTISGNFASHGGAVDLNWGLVGYFFYSSVRSKATIIDSTITGNTAADSGGGLNINGSLVTLIRSVVSNNVASTGSGGGIFCSGSEYYSSSIFGNSTLDTTIVSGNRAEDSGGGIAARRAFYFDIGCSTLITDSALYANAVTAGDGGGLHTENGLVMKRSTVNGNSATGKGGGINFRNTSQQLIEHSTISGNSAGTGGGIRTRDDSDLVLNFVTVAENTASYGGGIDVNGINGELHLDHALIVNNQSKNCSAHTTVVLNGLSLDDDDSCGNATFNPAAGNISWLRDHGGALLPTRQNPKTHVPCKDVADPLPECAGANPALEFSAASGCASEIDQRSFARPLDADSNGTALCDAGAIEMRADMDSDGLPDSVDLLPDKSNVCGTYLSASGSISLMTISSGETVQCAVHNVLFMTDVEVENGGTLEIFNSGETEINLDFRVELGGVFRITENGSP